MDPETTMATVQEGAKAVNKLGEIVEKIFAPRLTKKQADADAYATEKRIETIRNNPDMEIQYNGADVKIRELAKEELIDRAKQRQLANLVREQANIEAVIDLAKNNLRLEESVSDEDVDEDWIARFFNIVKDVNSDEMKLIWGKILAGEVKKPGSFSLRTLETIKNLSKSDAELFEKIMPFIVVKNALMFTPSNGELLKQYGITYSNLMKLNECGLIDSSGVVSIHLLKNNRQQECFDNGTKLIILEAKDKIKAHCSIGIYPLTSAGVELYNTLLHTPNHSFFSEFAKTLRQECKRENVEVSIYTFVEKYEDGSYLYNNIPELTIT